MRYFAAVLLLVVCFCHLPVRQSNTDHPTPMTPPTSPEKPKVDVHAPNVDVKSENGETTVKTPGTDVDVNRK